MLSIKEEWQWNLQVTHYCYLKNKERERVMAVLRPSTRRLNSMSATKLRMSDYVEEKKRSIFGYPPPSNFVIALAVVGVAALACLAVSSIGGIPMPSITC